MYLIFSYLYNELNLLKIKTHKPHQVVKLRWGLLIFKGMLIYGSMSMGTTPQFY